MGAPLIGRKKPVKAVLDDKHLQRMEKAPFPANEGLLSLFLWWQTLVRHDCASGALAIEEFIGEGENTPAKASDWSAELNARGQHFVEPRAK